MAANYVIVAHFCDWAGPFLKFQKNRHIAVRKPRFRFGSALKPAVFGLVSKTVTALHYTTLDPSLGLCIGQPVRQALALACEGSIRHPMRKKEEKKRKRVNDEGH